MPRAIRNSSRMVSGAASICVEPRLIVYFGATSLQFPVGHTSNNAWFAGITAALLTIPELLLPVLMQ